MLVGIFTTTKVKFLYTTYSVIIMKKECIKMENIEKVTGVISMDTELMKNLLLKVVINKTCSICDTCINKEENENCKYRDKDECTNNLEKYIPNSEVINS